MSSVINKVYDGFSMSLNLLTGLYIKYTSASSFVIITYPRSAIIFPPHSTLCKSVVSLKTKELIRRNSLGFSKRRLYSIWRQWEMLTHRHCSVTAIRSGFGRPLLLEAKVSKWI